MARVDQTNTPAGSLLRFRVPLAGLPADGNVSALVSEILNALNVDAWNDATTYFFGASVTHDGKRWFNLLPRNLNNPPADDSDHWAEIKPGAAVTSQDITDAITAAVANLATENFVTNAIAAAGHASAADLAALTARVAALEQGAPPPTTHSRYAIVRTAADVPTAAEFEASAISSNSQIIQLPAYADQSYIWFAEIYDSLDFIGEAGGQNSRALFSENPTNVGDISGTTYYAYGSVIAVDPVAQAVNWELVRNL